jgi:hypothetical protein
VQDVRFRIVERAAFSDLLAQAPHTPESHFLRDRVERCRIWDTRSLWRNGYIQVLMDILVKIAY